MRDDRVARSEAALRGKALFGGRAGCIACHNGPLLTDQAFHNTAVPTNPVFKGELHLECDPGRYRATKDEADLGKWRTPPLRYLEYTVLYMHNGVFFDLYEVMEHCNRGGEDEPFDTKSPLMRPLGLSDPEVDDLVTFIENLSGSEMVVERPKSPPYGVLDFPMTGQW